MMHDVDGLVCSVLHDPCISHPDIIWVQRSHWLSPISCTLVKYPDVETVNMVFSTLAANPRENNYIAVPICYQDGLIAYEQCSSLTRDLLALESFPVKKTYNTVRRTLMAMFDLHEVGVGGLPSSVSSFVRTEDESENSKIYYASILRRNCTHDEWMIVVETDYARMVEFVEELIEEPDNSLELMKSKLLFDHFIHLLKQYCYKSPTEKQGLKKILLGHPLLMEYGDAAEYLKFVAFHRSQRSVYRVVVNQVLSNFTTGGWQGRVSELASPNEERYRNCLAARPYNNSFFVDYCRDFMGHPHDYDLFNEDFCWERMIRTFEILYPSYIGLIWVALCKVGVRPGLRGL